MSLDNCPNCKREFYTDVKDAYCEECWRAWCKADGSFEKMERQFDIPALTRRSIERFPEIIRALASSERAEARSHDDIKEA